MKNFGKSIGTLMDKTKEYYNIYAKEFIKNTENSNMEEIYCVFESYLQPFCSLLDLGCGSGRDSVYFKTKGYKLTSIDYSQNICNEVKKSKKIDVLCVDMRSLEFTNSFHAIWACASFLHLSHNDFLNVLNRCYNALKENGIIYFSLKEGSGEKIINQRFFSFYTKDSLKILIDVQKFEIKRIWKTLDVRPNQRKTVWINVILRKI